MFEPIIELRFSGRFLSPVLIGSDLQRLLKITRPKFEKLWQNIYIYILTFSGESIIFLKANCLI